MELLDIFLHQLSELENETLIFKNDGQKGKLLCIKSKLDRIINRACNIPVRNFVNRETVNINKSYNEKSLTDKNIVIQGLPKIKKYNSRNSKQAVENFLNNELEINVKIMEVIKLGKSLNSVLVKLDSIEDKGLIFKNCAKLNKELKVNIVEDLIKAEREEKRKLMPKCLDAKAN